MCCVAPLITHTKGPWITKTPRNWISGYTPLIGELLHGAMYIDRWATLKIDRIPAKSIRCCSLLLQLFAYEDYFSLMTV